MALFKACIVCPSSVSALATTRVHTNTYTCYKGRNYTENLKHKLHKLHTPINSSRWDI